MYISKIKVEGFRNFKNTEVLFDEGINVIIGHNNAGKTNLLKALSLVIDSTGGSKRLDVDDFHKQIELSEIKQNPPSIRISLFISESTDENLHSDDLVTISNWITKLDKPYEARLTYEFFLPETEKGDYVKAIDEVKEVETAWKIIKRDFVRKYVYKIFGGDPKFQNQAEAENLQKFDFQFLNAIRDVERDMFTGKSTLLRDVLQFFMDYEIKKDTKRTKQEQTDEIKKRQVAFETKTKPVIDELLGRVKEGQKEILDYATKTGASFNQANPNFEGNVTETELLSALKLIIEHKTGIKVPATHNGLGYNNLIFMSLLLAKMQANADGNYYGSNAKVYPILAIEEPEAHLHPSMQYKFLKFLKENNKKKVRQVFVTTHSTHITSAVSLDDIICLHGEDNKINIGYPGKVFSNDEDGKSSKAYIERFLDATRSNILFAQKIILVEGLAEQLLMKTLARHVNVDKQLEDFHVEVSNVGGRYFEHFLKLFDSNKSNTIHKKIACITDRDPERKEKSGKSFEKCYPFEYNADFVNYEYKDNASEKINLYAAHPNIRFFSQEETKGKTLEYQIAFENPLLKNLINDSIKNKDELEALVAEYKRGDSTLADFKLRDSEENKRIISGVSSAPSSFSDEDKKKSIIASRYLNSVGKGENALELSVELEKDFDSGSPKFIVPEYLKDALEWLLK
ncbi:MAG TPA: AAA family ATPase [Bacteroidia bacterium]|nr:AAA family ATPase [Bacteroidia bacterium]